MALDDRQLSVFVPKNITSKKNAIKKKTRCYTGRVYRILSCIPYGAPWSFSIMFIYTLQMYSNFSKQTFDFFGKSTKLKDKIDVFQDQRSIAEVQTLLKIVPVCDSFYYTRYHSLEQVIARRVVWNHLQGMNIKYKYFQRSFRRPQCMVCTKFQYQQVTLYPGTEGVSRASWNLGVSFSSKIQSLIFGEDCREPCDESSQRYDSKTIFRSWGS